MGVMPASGLRSHYAAVRGRLRGHVPVKIRQGVTVPESKIEAVRVYDFQPGPWRMTGWKVIVTLTCEKWGVSLTDVLGNSRVQKVSHCRQEIFYRLRRETTLSFPEIGRRLKKHHATVIHGVAAHAERNGLPL